MNALTSRQDGAGPFDVIAAGALVAARLACADAMPSESEVNDLLKETVDV